MKKILTTLLVSLVFIGVTVSYVILVHSNSYQVDGQISIKALNEPVTIHRDQYGIPYVFAGNVADAIRAQGFVIAQDRILQIEMYRALIDGRLASIIGEAGLNSDIKMRVIGIRRNAERHLSFLSDESKSHLAWYAQGYNSFVNERTDEYPLELGLLGINPKKMELVDLLAIQHFAGFLQGRNYEDEILSINMAVELGLEKARSLTPLNINPDRKVPVLVNEIRTMNVPNMSAKQKYRDVADINMPVALPASGSNNWVTGSSKSTGGLPILVNDPHLDATVLPGPWYPIGIFTPQIQAIGANLPGVPGLLLGRTQHVSFGVTNAYGDSQDLYIEKLDPNNAKNYMDGLTSRPFQVEHKTITVKDDSTENGSRQESIAIRYTKRGPVISDHQVFGIKSNDVVVLRMAAAEVERDSLGVIQSLTAKTVTELDESFSKIDLLYINYVFADASGGIGHRSTGLIPLRVNGETAKVASPADDWNGYIPKGEMPGQINPEKNWLGTSNHDVIPDDYPYYYSTHFSPNYRYLRTKELLSDNKLISAEDHWTMLKDVKNKHAQRITPIFLAAIENYDSLASMYHELSSWNFEDQVDSVAATMFHLTHEYLIRMMFDDDVSEELLSEILKSRYYWLQRTDDMIVSGESEWFDMQSTQRQETLNDLIVMAALKSQAALKEKLGHDQNDWRWGKFHKVSFVSPLRMNGIGKDLLGGGTHEVSGSGETLNRGQYSLNEGPYQSQWFSSLRMVADMSDDQKVMGSISGGNASRQFHPYFKSQLTGWLNQEWVPWWFDKSKIEQHSKHKVELLPSQ